MDNCSSPKIIIHFDDFSINYAGDEIGLYPFAVAWRTPAVYSPSKITHRSGHAKMHDVFGIGVVVQRERGVYLLSIGTLHMQESIVYFDSYSLVLAAN